MQEGRIKELEAIEQRMVSDLQRTLKLKNEAINQLNEKSAGLKKVMQPRQAYKYVQKQSRANLHDHIQSHYQFLNQGSRRNLGETIMNGGATPTNGCCKFATVYGKRSNSTTAGVAPPSGNEGIIAQSMARTNYVTTGKKPSYSNMHKEKTASNEMLFLANNNGSGAKL